MMCSTGASYCPAVLRCAFYQLPAPPPFHLWQLHQNYLGDEHDFPLFLLLHSVNCVA